jgi:hypothetical protein
MPSSTTPVEIPRPEKVRQRLAECLQEARLLRSLLRVSTQAEQSRQRKGETKGQGEGQP